MPEPLEWKPFMKPIPRQRERLIHIARWDETDCRVTISFDPVSHFLFKEVNPNGPSTWTVAALPCKQRGDT